MKKLITLFFALFIVAISFSQETTTGEAIVNTPINKSKVLVVPFETKMYISDIDKDLAIKNEMSYQDIKAKFRAALDREIFISLREYYTPLSFYSIDPQEAKKELAYIYNSVGYKYEVVPEEEVVVKKSATKKLLGKFKKKKKEDKYIEAGVQNGQIVSQVDNREKFMKTTLPNEKLIPSLNTRFQAGHYIFINELDIKRGANSVYQASEEQYLREIKVHYTIFDSSGNEISAGAIKTRFKDNQNDVNKIIREQFPLISRRIVEKLVGERIAQAE
jgi:hypothetical protein